jgi:carbamoyltransferase
MWRPFAASVLREHMGEYFDIDVESPFMLLAADVRNAKKDEIPSVVHVDGTCRLQSLTREDNGIYYDLVRAVYEITGRPLVLNTSFNLGGDPIVETPSDALDSFTRTDIDCLVIGDFIVTKK